MKLIEQPVVSLNQACSKPSAGWQASKIEHDLNRSILNHHQSFESSLGSLFLNDKKESKLQKARAILKETADNISDDELSVYLTEFQSLLDGWLDIFEKQIFNGKTLDQILKEE
jgi:phosphatidylinositol kinase/protein kinase (PI-3  family)